MVGTAALLAVAAVLALAVGTILRRSAAAVAAVVVLIVLPYILAVAVGAAGRARAVAAAGHARRPPSPSSRALPEYPQVHQAYTPASGFFPLAPWAGFAVLCGWTAAALGRRRGPAAPEGRMTAGAARRVDEAAHRRRHRWLAARRRVGADGRR